MRGTLLGDRSMIEMGLDIKNSILFGSCGRPQAAGTGLAARPPTGTAAIQLRGGTPATGGRPAWTTAYHVRAGSRNRSHRRRPKTPRSSTTKPGARPARGR